MVALQAQQVGAVDFKLVSPRCEVLSMSIGTTLDRVGHVLLPRTVDSHMTDPHCKRLPPLTDHCPLLAYLSFVFVFLQLLPCIHSGYLGIMDAL